MAHIRRKVLMHFNSNEKAGNGSKCTSTFHVYDYVSRDTMHTITQYFNMANKPPDQKHDKYYCIRRATMVTDRYDMPRKVLYNRPFRISYTVQIMRT
jgi:hypothetical protein